MGSFCCGVCYYQLPQGLLLSADFISLFRLLSGISPQLLLLYLHIHLLSSHTPLLFSCPDGTDVLTPSEATPLSMLVLLNVAPLSFLELSSVIPASTFSHFLFLLLKLCCSHHDIHTPNTPSPQTYTDVYIHTRSLLPLLRDFQLSSPLTIEL